MIKEYAEFLKVPSFIDIYTIPADSKSAGTFTIYPYSGKMEIGVKEKKYKSSLIHELVHLIQNINGDGVTRPLGLENIPFSIDVDWLTYLLSNFYPVEKLPIEIEAWGVEEAFATQPTEVENWIREHMECIDKVGEEPKEELHPYILGCKDLMKSRGFIFGNGDTTSIVLNFLHTPMGMLKSDSYVMSQINELAREDVMTKNLKDSKYFKFESEAQWYLNCVRYWMQNKNIAEKFK